MKYLVDPTFARFLLVGTSNTVISYSVYWFGFYWLFSNFTYKAAIAHTLSYSIGIVWSFLWNRYFTFKYQGTNNISTFSKFLLTQVTIMFFSSGAIALLVDYLRYEPNLSWLVVMAIVTILNFVISKLWVFRSIL